MKAMSARTTAKRRSLFRRAVFAVVGCLFILSPPAGAQYTANYQTNIISGVTSNWSGDYLVGSNTFADALLIKNGGVLSDAFGYLGYEVGSSNNSAVVADTNSVWNSNPSALGVPYNLCIGYRGAGNRLTISNGGYVANAIGTVGFAPSSSNNSVVVTGSGSVWSNKGFVFIGYFGSGNSLVISNGGQVISSGADAGIIGLGSGNNTVLVTGTNSIWNNWGTFSALGMGNTGGANNSLVISNAAQVISASAYVSGESNRVRVVNGGVWQNKVLYVGWQGAGNSLVVVGGSVFATNLVVGFVGFASPTCDNLVQLDSGNIVVTNATHDAMLEVSSGKFILNGGVVQADTLVVTNACGRFVRNGGTLLYSQLVLDPALSAVGDGIPNGWKQQYGFDPFDPNLSSEDADGDGMSNLQEYLAGTDPTNSASAFRIIRIAREGADIRVTWATAGGRTNVLQAANSVSGVYFNSSSNFVIAGTGDVVTNWLDQGAAANVACRFYRVALRSLSVQDTNAPTLTITSPAADLVITNSTVTVTGTSADASGVSGVEVQGMAASSVDGYSNWVAVVTGLADGTNTLTVLAGDNSAPANMATGTVRVICATGSFDGNGDGLPDGWQIKYFGSVDAPNAAPNADPDGDGILNLQEFLDGTDPTLPAPAAPLGLTATAVSTNQINLSWTDNSTNENGFAIERAPDSSGNPGTWAQIATASSNVTAYSDTGVSAGTNYWYRVRAYNAGGDSDYSNQASATTPALCPRLVVGWGANSSGQATPPAGLEWVTAIAGGSYHSLALKSDGTVVGWGDNGSGQTNTPAGLSNVVAIAAGAYFSLALKSDGTVTNWGDSYYGSPPPGLSNVVAVAAGGYFSLALKTDGTVTNWGDSYYGKPPAGLSNVVAIAARDYNSLALKGNGTVVGWGYAPTTPASLSNVVAIALGPLHCLALKSNGTVVGWGDNSYGKATPPAGLSNVVAIAAGYDFSLALKRDGTVVGWGSGSAATPPAGLAPAVAIAAGYYHSLALTTPCSLSAPSALRATAVLSTQINLSWLDDSSDEDGFRIERAPDIGGFPGAWMQIATVGTNVTTYSDTGLPAHTKYWYRVRAYNGAGDSDYSNPATATTPNLESPSGLVATATSTNQIVLSWKDNSGNEDGFEIERAPDVAGNPGSWTQIATVGTNVTTYSDTGLTANTKYWYRARAYNAADNSDYSNQASATTPALCPRLVVGWGYNNYGQATPPAGLEWVVAVAAGDDFSLALKRDGTVVGWGYSPYATVPAGLSNVVAISANYEHSLALKSDGTVTNWGYGPPSPPAGLSNVIAIAAGYYHDLVLKSDGTVTNWGSGQSPPRGLSNVVAIAAGNYQDLALKSDGTVVAWGGSTPPLGLTNVVAIAAGREQSLVLKSDGTVVGWGGTGGTPPAGLNSVVAIAAGNLYSLALKSDGTVVGWGSTSYGKSTPPAGLTRVTAIAAGGNHSLALTLPCSVSAPSALTATAISPSQINLSWLDNAGGENGFKIERSPDGANFTQIAQVLPNTTSYRNTGLWPGTTYYYRVRPYNSGGDGDFSNVASAGTPAQCLTSIVGWGSGPALPLDLTNVVAITCSSSSFFDLAVKSDGTVVRWGGPTPPADLSNVVAIAAGFSHGLALKTDGTVVGWGSSPPATPPAGLSNVVAIAAGYRHSLALKSDGTVVGWGINSYGETNVPAGLSGVVGIAAGYYYSLALKSDGAMVGWGRNDYGLTNPPALRAVAIAAGYYHGLALTSYGTVVGWGNNSYGQTNVPAGLSGVVGIAAGYDHSLALKSNGTVVGWGGGPPPPAGLSSVVAIAAGRYHSLAVSCAPNAPSTLVATTASKSQINLSWTDNSINESRFGIERAASFTGPWTEIGSVDSDVTTYPDTGLSCGQTYYYRVRAYDDAGGSPYSNIANANTSPDDLDCDGIADSWMQQYFGHPFGQASDNSRATDDADGDGQNNLAEFLAGTDPTNSASAFRIIEVRPDDADILIAWTAVGGKWYVLQTTTGYGGSFSNDFVDLDAAFFAFGTGETEMAVRHLGAATNAPARFYRVRLVP